MRAVGVELQRGGAACRHLAVLVFGGQRSDLQGVKLHGALERHEQHHLSICVTLDPVLLALRTLALRSQ